MKNREPYSKEQCTMSSIWLRCLICSGMCEERAKDFAERRKQENAPEGQA